MTKSLSVSIWGRTLRPSENSRRLLYLMACGLVVVGWLTIGFVCLFPENFRNSNAWYLRSALAVFMIRTFQFHFGLLFALLLASLLIMKKWRISTVTLALVGFLWWPTFWEWLPRPQADIYGSAIRIMSVNLRASNREFIDLIRQLREQAPDVILFQEYTSYWHSALQRTLKDEWPNQRFLTRNGSYSSAIYTRLQFAENPTEVLDTVLEPFVRAVVEIEGRSAAIYNIHLARPGSLTHFYNNRVQIAELLHHLKHERLPFILGGDFNFTDTSPQACALASAGFREAQTAAGWGRGTTWPVHPILGLAPGIRLDHFYFSPELTCFECYPGDAFGSDHLPVVTAIGFCKDEP